MGHWDTGKEFVSGNIEAEIVAVLSSLPLLVSLCIRTYVTLFLPVDFLAKKKSPVILCLLYCVTLGLPVDFLAKKNTR